MSAWQPSVGEERWTALAVRMGFGQDVAWLRARTGPWKRVSVVLRCALFVLAASLAAMTLEVGSLLHLPLHLLLTGLGLLGAAEWLIQRRQMFCIGLDEALWLAGALMIAGQALEDWNTLWSWHAALLVALALGLATARLRNPGFGVLAVMALSATVFLAAQHALGEHPATLGAAGVCFAAACVALLLGQRTMRRPSLDLMLDWQVVSMPAGAWLWLMVGGHSGPSLEELRQGNWASCLPAVLLSMFAVTAVLMALRRHVRAPLLAAMLCCGLLALELRRVTPLSLEARLMVYGIALLLSSIAMERYLRTARRGITSVRLRARVAPASAGQGLGDDEDGSLELLQQAGAAGLVPDITTAAPPAPANSTGAGGTFGGGGATERY